MTSLDTARREWLVRAIVLNSRLEKERIRYVAAEGRNLETRQLEAAEARLDEHWQNAASLTHPDGSE